jgi:hypothetical protein
VQDFIALFLTAIIVLGLGFLLQWMGGQGILFAIPEANKFALVVPKGGSPNSDGGGVVDVIHAIPGYVLMKPSSDAMSWYFKKGEEERDLLFKLLGVVWLGPYQTLRTNTVRSFRFGRKDEESEYRVMPKDEKEKWVHFSAQHDMQMKDVETKDVLGVNININLLYNNVFPVRSILIVADSNAVLNIMTEEEVINTVGNTTLKKIVSGTRNAKQEIADNIMGIKREIRKKIGKWITSIDIFEISMNDETRDLMELEETTEKKNAAEIAVAEKDKKVAILRNDHLKDHNDRVILPLAAAGADAVRIRHAEALEKLTNLTTYAPGADVMVGTK